jgi:hypothetical protein
VETTPKAFRRISRSDLGSSQESSIVDDEKKLPHLSGIALNVIAFQRTWQIPPPTTGLWFFGRYNAYMYLLFS